MTLRSNGSAEDAPISGDLPEAQVRRVEIQGVFKLPKEEVYGKAIDVPYTRKLQVPKNQA